MKYSDKNPIRIIDIYVIDERKNFQIYERERERESERVRKREVQL